MALRAQRFALQTRTLELMANCAACPVQPFFNELEISSTLPVRSARILERPTDHRSI